MNLFKKLFGQNKPNSTATKNAISASPANSGMKSQSSDGLKFPSKPIKWDTNLTGGFHVEKPISFANEQDIIIDLETANLESLSADMKWNLSLCLAYGSDQLTKATTTAILKVIQKKDSIEPLRWMVNTMLNTGELPSGINWDKGLKGIKSLYENCPAKYKDEFYNLILNSTNYDIAYSYNPNQDESNTIVFVQETKKQSRVMMVQMVQGQVQTQRAPDITTYRVYRGASKKAAYDFLTKNIVNQRLFHLVIETPEGNFCRDINGIYKER